MAGDNRGVPSWAELFVSQDLSEDPKGQVTIESFDAGARIQDERAKQNPYSVPRGANPDYIRNYTEYPTKKEIRVVDPKTGGESKYANTKPYEDRGWRRPRPVHSVDPLDLSWAAGLIEGEGSVWVKSGPYPAAVIQLSMTDEDVVRKLHRVMQVGDVYLQKPGQRSVKLQWKWRVSAQSHVAWALDLLYPLMGTRRKIQIDRAREVLPEWSKS